MTILYPDIEPYITHQIAVGKEHVLMVEESGNPEGIPVVFLHGGPGSSCKPYHRSIFNPTVYRIVLFDQRGAGRSTPTGSLQNNTTADLLADMEAIRKRLGIKKWVVFGSSWGATLGLLYAQQHPEQVLGVILRSIFLARQCDIDWFGKDGGVSRLFPQQWQAFIHRLSEEQRKNPLATYHEQLMSEETATAHVAALAWATWNSYVVTNGAFPAPTDPLEVFNGVRIECHYMFNRCFIEENQLLRDIDKVTNLPAILIHGQRDLICPLEASYLLAQNWQAAELKIIPTGGHLTSEPLEMLSAVVEATESMIKRLD